VNQSDIPVISVLIVTYNNALTIDNCLDALAKQTFPKFEICLLDNASSDDTRARLDNHHNLKLTKSPQNIGFAASMNQLAKQASGKFLFILNPDCLCPPDTMQTLLEFSETHPGAISPALVFPNGKIHPSARELPDYSNILFSRRSPLSLFGVIAGEKAGFMVPAHAAKVPAVSATALFIPKSTFEEVGHFDERYFLYCEDLDLCRQLNDRNIDIWYLPELKITHLLRVSSRKNPLKPLYHHHHGILKYFTKYYPRNYIKNSILFVMLVFGFIFSALVTLAGTTNSDD
jgi:N-acetylglucosaminyl-diphospho-decaprenol L-rhamnosyltransferase